MQAFNTPSILDQVIALHQQIQILIRQNCSLEQRIQAIEQEQQEVKRFLEDHSNQDVSNSHAQLVKKAEQLVQREGLVNPPSYSNPPHFEDMTNEEIQSWLDQVQLLLNRRDIC
ncbi:MAG: hypothetical protein KME16_11660 [Scytolyngbya sp. HA4215-MV1]|jgi:glutamate synthase domain-containing protein 3|nr:hypothetical protein [Scytolyngbya sp. HA4215-MV1]